MSEQNFQPGQKLTKENYTQGALWCLVNGCRIEKKEDGYFIVVKTPHTPTPEERVAGMEAATGLTRFVRELVLAENSGASDYVKAKAQEIEELAKELRG